MRCEQEDGALLTRNKPSFKRQVCSSNLNKRNTQFTWSVGWEEKGAWRGVSIPKVPPAHSLIDVWGSFKPRALSSEKQEKLWKEGPAEVFMGESAFSLGLKGTRHEQRKKRGLHDPVLIDAAYFSKAHRMVTYNP